MSDDHAAHALSCYGSHINRTPNLDRIATNGMRFQNCFVNNSICTPSRAAILTGKYSHMNGVTVFNRFDGSQPHLAKYFQQAGYNTALIGKWHLFSDPTGFDYWNVLPGQGKYHDPVMIEMGKTNNLKGYVTDIITDLSIDFLKRHDRAKPFFLCSHHKAPHREWSPDARHASLYEDKEIRQPATFNDDYRGKSRAAAEATMRIERDFKKADVKQTPPEGLSGPALKNWHYQRYIKDYLRCIASVDDNVGRLLDYLKDSGLETNTLVVYTSDQGFFLGDHGWYDKRFMYEESLRMPLLVSFPGMIKAGTVNTQMVLNVDFAPTFLDLAGVRVPSDMQGTSAMPLLRGESPPNWRTSMYYRYYHYPGDHRVQAHTGVRTYRYKLIHFDKLDEWELYDLESDPREMKNLYHDAAMAGTISELKNELMRLKKELKDEDQFADILDNGQKLRPVALELAFRDAGSKKGAEAQLPENLSPAGKPLTFGAWCKPEKLDGVVLSWGGSGNGFALYLKDGFPHAAVRSKSELFVVRGRQKIEPGQPAHLAGVLRATGSLGLLFNGKPIGATPATALAAKPKEGLAIGADPGSKVADYSVSDWGGLIEEVRIYWGELDTEGFESWVRTGLNIK